MRVCRRPRIANGRLSYATSWVATCLKRYACSSSRSSRTRSAVRSASRLSTISGSSTEVRIRPGQGRRLEDPTDDRCDLHGSARRLGQLVDAREDEALQALGQVEASHGRRVPQVDPAPGDVGHELLGVERHCPPTVVDERHEIVADLRRRLRTQDLRELRANECGGVVGVEPVERDLLEVRDALDPDPAAGGPLRSVREDEQHRQRGRRPPSDSSRSRESASIQWQSSSTRTDRLPIRASARRWRGDPRARSSQLRVEGGGQLRVGDLEPEDDDRSGALATRSGSMAASVDSTRARCWSGSSVSSSSRI